MSALQQPFYTPEQYLEIERRAAFKSEYYVGQMFAMAGASREHNVIARNVIRRLGNALDGRPCETYPSDMKVLVSAGGLYTYPDVSVACGEPQFLDRQGDVLLNPLVIVEVLSDTTEAYDRGRSSRSISVLSRCKSTFWSHRTGRAWRATSGNPVGSGYTPEPMAWKGKCLSTRSAAACRCRKSTRGCGFRLPKKDKADAGPRAGRTELAPVACGPGAAVSGNTNGLAARTENRPCCRRDRDSVHALASFCLNPYRPPLLRSLPNMPADLVIVTFLGGVKVVVFSLPMLTVLVLAGAGLAIDLWGWPVGRRTTRHGGFWMTALGFALNLLPFVLFARFFVTDITASVME